MTALAPPTTSAFRDYARAISPTSLQGPNGQRLMFTLAIEYDALADSAGYAVRFRFPSLAPDDALPYLALDRQIDRGPNESRASYVQRLIEWLDLWRTAGSQRAILNALSAYLLPGSYTVETVNDSLPVQNVTTWDVSIGGADPPTHYQTTPFNWTWDALFVRGRSWVIIYAGPWAQTPLIGGFKLGDGTVLGFNATVNDAPSIRAEVKKWKSAGDYVSQIIVAFDTAWYQPTHAIGAHMPDGTWGTWGIEQNQTPNLMAQWGKVMTETESFGQWGEVNIGQVPGPEGTINFARVYQPRSTRTTTTATSARSYIPNAARSPASIALTMPCYIPGRVSSSCFLGPVL